MLHASYCGPSESTLTVRVRGPSAPPSAGSGTVAPWTIDIGSLAWTLSPSLSQPGSAAQSSSVNATSAARADLQPALRAAAGPRGASSLIVLSGRAASV